MAELTLDVARKILDAALAKGIGKKLKPLVITILDARGCVKMTAAQDGTSCDTTRRSNSDVPGSPPSTAAIPCDFFRGLSLGCRSNCSRYPCFSQQCCGNKGG